MCRIYLGHCIAPVGCVCVCVCVCWWGGRDQQVQLEHEAHAACYDVIDMMYLSSRSLMFSGIYETVAG